MIISLFSGKGGVGKTTLTANLATNLVLLGKRVLTIDFDPLNQLGVHLGLGTDEIAGLSREGIASDSIFESPLGVHFIPFGKINQKDLHHFEIQLKSNPQWLPSAINQISQHGNYDFILIDNTSTPGVFMRQAIQSAEYIWLVLLAEAASQLTLPQAIRTLESSGRPFEILLNQFPEKNPNSKESEYLINELFGDKILPISIPRDKSIPEALAHETTISDYNPETPAQDALKRLAALLIERQLIISQK